MSGCFNNCDQMKMYQSALEVRGRCWSLFDNVGKEGLQRVSRGFHEPLTLCAKYSIYIMDTFFFENC